MGNGSGVRAILWGIATFLTLSRGTVCAVREGRNAFRGLVH